MAERAGLTSAEMCRRNGWHVGMRLVGDEGYGPTVIEITAIGERYILAKTISRNGVEDEDEPEGHWTLRNREWEPW